MTNSIDVSFFIPCLNEEKNIHPTLNNLVQIMDNFNLNYEIVICDDYSKDSTLQVIENFIINNKHLSINLIKNKYKKGLGRNYIDCAFIAKGKYYMLINGDNAEPGETIITILKNFSQADMIIPFFDNEDNRSVFRVFTSKFFTFVVNLLSGLKIPYYNGPVLHLRYNVMRWSPDTHGYAYQAELITRIIMEGGNYITVKIKNISRKQGISKAFNFQNLLSVLHSLLQIFLRRLRIIMFYSNKN